MLITEKFIQEILSADKAAEDKLLAAKAKQKNISSVIEKSKKEIYDKYLENARIQVEKAVSEKRLDEQTKLEALRTKYSASIAALEDAKRENFELWVDNIVRNVLENARR